MARYEYDVYYFALLGFISFTLVLSNRDSEVSLAYKCVQVSRLPASKSLVIMLHGLTMTKETWDGIYQATAFLTGRKVCVYDARNHGDSGWNDTFTIDALAEDVGNFMRQMKIKTAALVGHSLGGLTIMKFALKNPYQVESIFVEDVSPKQQPRETNDNIVMPYLKLLLASLSAIPADADEETATKAVIDFITKVTKNPPPRELFKGSPLRRKDGVWQWKSNIKVFIKAFEGLDSLLGKMEGLYDKRSFFIYGKESPLKVIEDKEYITKLFPNAEFFGVEGAGHTVHSHSAVYLRKLAKFFN